MAEKILEVVNLGTRFKTERGVLKAIDGVSFDVYRGEMLGIVGELWQKCYLPVDPAVI